MCVLMQVTEQLSKGQQMQHWPAAGISSPCTYLREMYWSPGPIGQSINYTKPVNKIVKYAWLGQVPWEQYKPFRGEGVLFKTVGEKGKDN